MNNFSCKIFKKPLDKPTPPRYNDINDTAKALTALNRAAEVRSNFVG